MESDTYLARQSQRGKFSGAVLVSHKGTALLNQGYGLADREAGHPSTPETLFQIASVSKQFTAAAIILLQEQGKLSVQDTICAWLPECPEQWRAITIHQLLTHTSGIAHWRDLPGLDACTPSPGSRF